MDDVEKRIYYDIITNTWKIFSKKRNYEEFSDDWWQDILDEFDTYCKQFKDTEYEEIVDGIVTTLLAEHTRRYRKWRTQ